MTDIDSTTWWERFRTNASNDEGPRLELYLRSLAPTPGTHTGYLEMRNRLDHAIGAGVVDACGTTVLGEKICLCDRCQETRLGRRLAETCFELRDGGDPDVDPVGFDERPIRSEMTGESYTVLVPPTVCLGVYEGDSLVGVFPSRIDGDVYEVSDFVRALSRSRPQSRRARIDA